MLDFSERRDPPASGPQRFGEHFAALGSLRRTSADFGKFGVSAVFDFRFWNFLQFSHVNTRPHLFLMYAVMIL
jgi:hypothetical protein